MALNFKKPELDRLARELASVTGETLTDAVLVALRERLDREEKRKTRLETDLAQDLMEIGRQCADLPVLDKRSEDEILGYDRQGLPD